MNFSTTTELYNAFADLKVLVIGDVMVDSYIWGKVSRISPEAPVPVVLAEKKEKRLGGAANVALNVQALGATPIPCSIVGDDVDGEFFLKRLKERGIPSKGVITSRERETTVKERVLSGSHQLLRVDTESTNELSRIEEKAMLAHIKKPTRYPPSSFESCRHHLNKAHYTQRRGAKDRVLGEGHIKYSERKLSSYAVVIEKMRPNGLERMTDEILATVCGLSAVRLESVVFVIKTLDDRGLT